MLGMTLWYITENNYCFGGYTVNPSFSEIIKEGVGSRPYIQFSMEYFAVGADYALYDANYSGPIGSWILETGFWDDEGVWIDTSEWID
jgi:hypothetical protein